ncbi:MAG: hypothetical protein WAO58_09955 [Fimbriimonadaceae bacterium]
MPDFIPQNHEAFRVKLLQFKDWIVANGATFGFSPGDITALTSAYTDVAAKLTAKVAADVEALSANEALQSSEEAATVLWRSGAARLQPHPNMTDALRANAGITVPDRIPTKKEVGVEVPGVEIDFGPGVITIHWGTVPTNELLNGKPVWAEGANIYIAVGSGPSNLVGFDKASPFRYLLTGPPVSLTIQVAYRTPDEDGIGTLSAPVTVSTGG